MILTQMEGDDSLESRDGDDDRSGSGARRRLITRLVSASCVRAEWESRACARDFCAARLAGCVVSLAELPSPRSQPRHGHLSWAVGPAVGL